MGFRQQRSEAFPTFDIFVNIFFSAYTFLFLILSLFISLFSSSRILHVDLQDGEDSSNRRAHVSLAHSAVLFAADSD